MRRHARGCAPHKIARREIKMASSKRQDGLIIYDLEDEDLPPKPPCIKQRTMVAPSRPSSPLTVQDFPDHGVHAAPRNILRIGSAAYATYNTLHGIYVAMSNGLMQEDVYAELYDKISRVRWHTTYDINEEWPQWGRLHGRRVPMWRWWQIHGQRVEWANEQEEAQIAEMDEELQDMLELWADELGGGVNHP